jgi:hypothetical protein
VATHDPQRVVELLRDHLAAHDKRLIFLFGAGTSSAVNIAPAPAPGQKPNYQPLIPALGPMTDKCKEAAAALSEEHKAAWEALEAECTALDLKPHIENVLGRIRRKIDATGAEEKVLGLTREQMEALEGAIRSAIVEMASPAEPSIPTSLPHDDFAVWVRHARRRYAIEIFTTNYDVLVERSLESARVPIFDGFVGSYAPYFSPEALDNDASMPSSEWIRLWKVHGSVNWEVRTGSVVRLTGPCSGEMILPSHRKYDESRKQPYLALLDRLARSMSREGTLMVTCGYSWNDEHINAAMISALDNHPANHVIALAHPPLDEVPNLCELAKDRMNLVAVGPREGIIRRERAEWALPNPIGGPTASFVDIAFDSDALPDEEASPITGRMRLGDFNWFCRFLLAMDSPALGL